MGEEMMTAKTIVRWYGKIFNRGVSQRLTTAQNSSLHKNHLLVSLQGRKSGKPYTFPVNYCLTPEGTYAISTEANWRHNFIDGLDVTLQVSGKKVSGHGVQIANDPTRRDKLGRMLTGFMWFFFKKSLTVIEITPTDRKAKL